MDDQTKLFIDISKNLGEINSKLSSLCDTIAKHEQRITLLEQTGKTTLKDDVIALLLKGMIISLLAIGSLTGASGLIAKFFGV